MVIYPSTLPCPLLTSGNSSEKQSFIRSQFDFDVRQRRVPRGKPTQSFIISVHHSLLDEWVTFWESVNFGNDPFEYSFMAHGSDNIDKVIRFIEPYKLTAVGANVYSISASIEILSNGTPKVDECPLVPYNTLYPSDTLTPC